jgi:alcohol dehydrogenase YqhD (iron-dependent ADH family)
LALPYFDLLADLFSSFLIQPTTAEVSKAAQIVHLKDAAIVAAAAKGKAKYLATHDVKHLLTHAQAIEAAYGITVIAPAELLSILTNSGSSSPSLPHPVDYKIGNIWALQLSPDSQIEANSTEVCKTLIY